MAKLYIQNS
ncbi:hypothetical protein CGCVW01_v006691 [Colletotrichum viniferum]|nr:hypothetical protein CGCVW01_v006691 [Colletotrichum viniferum]